MSQADSNQSANSRLHALVDGHVQGVGFRAFVIDNSVRLGLTGWVRNTWNGEVEVMAEGPRRDLESLLDLLREGPPAAVVTQVRQDWLTPTGEFQQFRVRFSGN